MKWKLSREWLVIALFAAAKLLLHFFTSTNYELHRDEFLYIAFADHFDFGYVSVPPAIAMFARLTHWLLGDSVFAYRFLPALFGAVSLVLIGLLVKEFGGRLFAIVIACSAFLLSPAFLRSNSLLQPVTFDEFFWLLSGYLIVKMINRSDPRYWLALGMVWGLAFLNKYAIGFLVVGVGLAFLLTSVRRLLFSKYLLFGAALGAILILPNLVWQYQHHWPVVHHLSELHRTQLVYVLWSNFLFDQLVMCFPAVWIWLIGLAALLLLKSERQYRVVAITYLLVVGIFILARGKSYYTLGLYSVLFAAGGTAIEKYGTARLAWIKYTVLTFMVLTVVPVLPYSLPMLSYEKMVEYGRRTAKYIGYAPLRWEHGEIHSLPQDYADMTGWEELSRIVVQAYSQLTEEEKTDCGIYAENYGEAASIRYYTHKLGLPEPISFSDNYLLWAPDSVRLSVLIYVNDEIDDISRWFGRVVEVGRIQNPYARESGLPVFICTVPKEEFFPFYAAKAKQLKDRYR